VVNAQCVPSGVGVRVHAPLGWGRKENGMSEQGRHGATEYTQKIISSHAFSLHLHKQAGVCVCVCT
jgi:hypothetical protein